MKAGRLFLGLGVAMPRPWEFGSSGGRIRTWRLWLSREVGVFCEDDSVRLVN